MHSDGARARLPRSTLPFAACAQLFVGLVICFASMGLYVGARPFREKTDMHMLMVIMCELMIFLSLASALTFGMCHDDEAPASSPDDWTDSVVTIFLFMVNLGPLVLILPLALIQLWFKLEMANSKADQKVARSVSRSSSMTSKRAADRPAQRSALPEPATDEAVMQEAVAGSAATSAPSDAGAAGEATETLDYC